MDTEENKNDLISILDEIIDTRKNKKEGKKFKLHEILSEFKGKIGEKKFEKLENESIKNPLQFRYVFGLYYTAAKDYIKKYTIKGFDEGIYFSGAVYSALRALERDLRSKGYNIYNSIWFNSKDSFAKMHLLKYLDKNEIKYLKDKKVYNKQSEIIYPLWMLMNGLAIIPLAKEGLITPHVYTAFLVGLGDIFFGGDIAILAALWSKVHTENKYKEIINYSINNKENKRY